MSGFNGGGPALQNPPGSAMGDENYALWRFRGVGIAPTRLLPTLAVDEIMTLAGIRS